MGAAREFDWREWVPDEAGWEDNVEREWDVLGLGIAAVDDLLYVDEYPQPDTKVAVRARQRQGGGLTATALVAAARLGARAAYWGVLGKDDLSAYTVRELEREGVDCSPVLRRADAGPCHSIVVVDRATGSRTILYDYERVRMCSPEEVDPGIVRRCRVLFVDYTSGLGGLRAAQMAREMDVPVVADVERLDVDGAAEIAAEAAHLIVSVDLARQLTDQDHPEDMIRALLHPKRACCAVTAGDRGCWYAVPGSAVRHVPAYDVAVVDTTGCGDVFHGAYAACIARGEGIDRAIHVATATAAIKATHPGGRAGIPDRATVEQFMRAHAQEEKR